MTRYFIAQDGQYIGGFDQAEPPPGAQEVPTPPPTHASQRWNGRTWDPTPPDPRDLRRQRIAELLAIPRSDWTVAQMRELLQIIAQTVPPFQGGTTGG